MTKKKKKSNKTKEVRPEMRSSTFGWIVLSLPTIVILFLLIFGSEISLVSEYSGKEAEDAARTVYNYGQQYLRNNDYQRAYYYFNEALKIKPDFAEAYSSIGQVYYRRGDLDNAISWINKSLSYNFPQKDLVMNNLGLLYAQKGDHRQALNIFEEVRKLGIRLENVYNNMGNVYMNMGNYAKAAEMFGLAIENRPDIESLYREMLYLTIVEYKDDKELVEARKAALEQYREGISPGRTAVYDSIIVERFSRTVKREVELRMKYGNALEMIYEYVKAKQQYLLAVKLTPNSVRSNYQTGMILVKLKEYEQALFFFEKVLKLDKNHAGAQEAIRSIESFQSSLDELKSQLQNSRR